MEFEKYLESKGTPPGTTWELGVGALTELAEDWRRQPCGVLTPLDNKLVVEAIEGDSQINGLTIPEGSREKPLKGIVVATGPNVSVTLKVGDVVLYAKHAGIEVQVENKDYLLMRESDIFAII